MIDPDPRLGPRIKLAHFGFAAETEDAGMSRTIAIGTRLYMAPEIVKGEEHSYPIDIWAVGVLAYYLLSFGQYPFPGISKETVNSKILNEGPDMALLANVP